MQWRHNHARMDTVPHELPSGLNRLVTALVIFTSVAALYFTRELLLPVILAFLLAFILTPPANWLTRLGLGRLTSAVAVFCGALVVLMVVAFSVGHQFVDLSAQLPYYKANLTARIQQVRQSTSGTFSDAADAFQDIQDELMQEGESKGNSADIDNSERTEEKKSANGEYAGLGDYLWGNSVEPKVEPDKGRTNPVDVRVISLPPSPITQLKEWLGPLLAPIGTMGIVLVLALFILIQRDEFRNRLILLVRRSNLAVTTELIETATSRVTGWLQAVTLINLMYGVGMAIGFYLIGIPNALLWGTFAFVLRYVPYFGPMISILMPLALAVATTDSWFAPAMVVGLFLLGELIVNNFLEPWLYGKSTGLSNVGIILAAIFWTWIWGIPGLIVAIPLTVCLVTIGRHVPQLEFLCVLLGEWRDLPVYYSVYQRLLARDGDEACELIETNVAENGVLATFENVVLPVLTRIQLDRHQGTLSEEQIAVAESTIDEFLEETGEVLDTETESGADSESRELQPLSVLVVAAAGFEDHAAAKMFGKFCQNREILISLASADRFSSEIIEHCNENPVDAILLSAIAPGSLARARLLIKRLRRQLPDHRIVLGAWTTKEFGGSTLDAKTFGENISVGQSFEQAVGCLKRLPRRSVELNGDAKDPRPDIETEDSRSLAMQ